jgi:hypothetical protein
MILLEKENLAGLGPGRTEGVYLLPPINYSRVQGGDRSWTRQYGGGLSPSAHKLFSRSTGASLGPARTIVQFRP